ncbi:MAG: hypothetical protein AAF998_24825, partial [Bacteroidota bacterium]
LNGTLNREKMNLGDLIFGLNGTLNREKTNLGDLIFGLNGTLNREKTNFEHFFRASMALETGRNTLSGKWGKRNQYNWFWGVLPAVQRGTTQLQMTE